jgi:hypothetical protein
MQKRDRWQRLFLVAVLFLLSKGRAEAAVVRFHYVPADPQTHTTMKPGCNGAGETSRWLGPVREPYNCALRPTQVLTFHHPYSGQNVSVPIAMPLGTPRILHARDRITFDYGSYAIRVLFLPDGSVDVVYDSGFLRAP